MVVKPNASWLHFLVKKEELSDKEVNEEKVQTAYILSFYRPSLPFTMHIAPQH